MNKISASDSEGFQIFTPLRDLGSATFFFFLSIFQYAREVKETLPISGTSSFSLVPSPLDLLNEEASLSSLSSPSVSFLHTPILNGLGRMAIFEASLSTNIHEKDDREGEKETGTCNCSGDTKIPKGTLRRMRGLVTVRTVE